MTRTGYAALVYAGLLSAIFLLISAHVAMARISALEYARQCEKLIGKLPDFNCFDGAEIKPTGRGRDPDGNVACENPSLLGFGAGQVLCSGGSRLLKFDPLPGASNSAGVALCRKDTAGGNRFSQIIALQYNKITGTTCWFHTDHNDTPDGRWVPSPSRATSGTAPWGGTLPASPVFWDRVSRTGPADNNCFSCHENDPVLHTPYLMGVSGKHALPAGDPLQSEDRPYANFRYHNFVGRVFPDWPVAMRLTLPAGNMCRDCHRFAVQCKGKQCWPGNLVTYLKNSVGQPHFQPPAGQKPRLPAGQKAFRFWMPPGHANMDKARVLADAKKVEQCMLEARGLDLLSDRSNLTAKMRANVDASRKKCGWHLSSIELAVGALRGRKWENGRLLGEALLVNENRYSAPGVRISTSVDGGAVGPHHARMDLGPDARRNSPFTLSGKFPENQAVMALRAWIDSSADPALKDGRFIEANETDNRKELKLRLNDLSVGFAGLNRWIHASRKSGVLVFRMTGPLPASGVKHSVRLLGGSRCVSSNIGRITDDWKPGEVKNLSFSLTNHCRSGPQLVKIEAAIDTGNAVPEFANVNNRAVREILLAAAPTGVIDPDLTRVEILGRSLRRTGRVFFDMCKYLRVTPDSKICTGLELLPKVRDPEDIVTPGPKPPPLPILEELRDVLEQLQKNPHADHDLLAETLEAVNGWMSGEIPERFPLQDLLAGAAMRLFEERTDPFELKIYGGDPVEVAPGWRVRPRPAAPGESLKFTVSDNVVDGPGRLVETMPWVWISGPATRPLLDLEIDLAGHDFDGEPMLIGLTEEGPAELAAFWDRERKTLTGKVPSDIIGLSVHSR